MSFLTSFTLPYLPSTIGFLALILEFSIFFSVTVGYISALALFIAYNTSYKAVDMSALYALKYAEALKIPLVVGGIIAAGIAMSAAARVATGSTINGVANAGWVMGGAIGRVLALPGDLICSLMFKRQCPQAAGFVESEEERKEAEKMPLLEVGEKAGDEMV